MKEVRWRKGHIRDGGSVQVGPRALGVRPFQKRLAKNKSWHLDVGRIFGGTQRQRKCTLEAGHALNLG